jgi:hypothetical protein
LLHFVFLRVGQVEFRADSLPFAKGVVNLAYLLDVLHCYQVFVVVPCRLAVAFPDDVRFLHVFVWTEVLLQLFLFHRPELRTRVLLCCSGENAFLLSAFPK